MKRKQNKDDSDEYSVSKKDNAEWMESANRNGRKGQEFQCGKTSCGKIYHSYTAFYNHCKKNHQGEFPPGSLQNDKPFQGPAKNRGRPRIKKNDAKDEIQIESMKTQNELIEFLGTLKAKKNEELVVYVQDPVQQLQGALNMVRQWNASPQYLNYLEEISKFNTVVTENDLPEFYDPIQIHLHTDKLDSYNFTSIYNFMVNNEKGRKYKSDSNHRDLLRKILICWLARILSQRLLAEVAYCVTQMNFATERMVEKELLGAGKSAAFKRILDKFFDCFLMEHQQREQKGERENDNDNYQG